jgi:hypothetical protein
MIRSSAARWGWLCLLAVAVAGCTSEDAGVTLDLGLVHQQPGTSQNGLPRVLAGQSGSVITLTRAWVNVGAVEILPCPATAWHRALRFLSPIGVADAHTAGSPTKIGVPHVDDLARPDGQSMDFGTFKPPADTYCQATVSLDAADDDAVGLPAPSVVPMSGNTIWIEGTVSPAGGGSPQTFTLTSAAEVDSTVAFISTAGAASPIALKTAGTARSARVVLRYDQWFSTVDPLAAGAGDALVSAIAQSLQVQAE